MNNDEIKQIITELLDQLGLEYSEVRPFVDNEISTTIFTIDAPDNRNIIGRNGDHLHALNYLVRRMVEKKMATSGVGTPNFTVDSGGFHKKKIDNLKIKARIIADRARSFKRTVELEPMSGYDRLIVHSFIANMPDMSTESTGVGNERRVTIKYEGSDDLFI